jgi:hypothetical protein
MDEHDMKFCPHCRAKYRTILSTCVYCNGHLRSVPGSFRHPEIVFVVVNLTAILLFALVALK